MRVFILTILTCFFSLSVLSQEEVDSLIKANLAFDKGNYHDAIKTYEELKNMRLKSNQKYKVLLKQGRCYSLLGDYEKAISLFEEVEDKKRGYATYDLAAVYAKQNNTDKCIEYLYMHINSRYKKPKSEIKLSNDFKDIQHTEAWKKFWLEDHYSKTEGLIANIHYLIKYESYLEALDEVDRLIEDKNKEKAELYYCRALIYKNLNDTKSAIKELKKAIKIKEKEKYYKERIRLFIEEQKYDNAIDDLNKLLSNTPEQLPLYLQRSKLYTNIGDFKKAKKDLSYYSKFVKSAKVDYEMGNIEYQAENYLEALKYFNKALDKEQSVDKYFIGRARVLGRTSSMQDACNDYSMALDINPKNPLVYVERGKIRFRKGDSKGACYDFKKAIQLGSKEAIKLYSIYCQ